MESVIFELNYTIDKSVRKTHNPPGECWAAVEDVVYHTLNCHSCSYVKTEHSSTPGESENNMKISALLN